METKIKEYKDAKAFEKDAQRMAEEGWAVASQSERTQRTGCMRFIMLGGIGALVFKPKPHIIVTYQRSIV